jgi:hypothetical protein
LDRLLAGDCGGGDFQREGSDMIGLSGESHATNRALPR